jgi:hypothetical protein
MNVWRLFVALAASSLAVLSSCLFGPIEDDTPPPPSVYRVASVQLVPIPEGPSGLLFTLHPSEGEFPLASIRAAIPHPLPPPIEQSCTIGGNVVITLGGASTMTYGPCELPPSIVRLKAAMLRYMRHRP